MKIKHFILILSLLFAAFMALFIHAVLWAWGSDKKEIKFNELSSKSQATIISNSNWCFSTNECIETIQYIRYGNDVEEIIVKIKTEDPAQFINKNENIKNVFSAIPSSELVTGETGYYSEGKCLFIAIQICDYFIMDKNGENVYISNLLKSILSVFEDTDINP